MTLSFISVSEGVDPPINFFVKHNGCRRPDGAMYFGIDKVLQGAGVCENCRCLVQFCEISKGVAKHRSSEYEAWLRKEKHWQCHTHRFGGGLMFPSFLETTPCCGKKFDPAKRECLKIVLLRDDYQPLNSLTSVEFEHHVDSLLEEGNYVGLGNSILETLMMPHQARTPDSNAKYLSKKMAEIVGAFFGMDPSLQYPVPHRDKYLAASQRGDWFMDTYVQMIFCAYLIGASWVSLPNPHLQLLEYYRKMAEEQEREIKIFKNRQKHIPAPPKKPEKKAPTVDQTQIQKILNSRLTNEEKEIEIMRLLNPKSDTDRGRNIDVD